jgi:hypothetical protein
MEFFRKKLKKKHDKNKNNQIQTEKNESEELLKKFKENIIVINKDVEEIMAHKDHSNNI